MRYLPGGVPIQPPGADDGPADDPADDDGDHRPGGHRRYLQRRADASWPTQSRPDREGAGQRGRLELVHGDAHQKPLAVGSAGDVRVFLGHQGHGKHTFCAVPDTFLPESVPVLATLRYKDKEGKERRVSMELRERC